MNVNKRMHQHCVSLLSIFAVLIIGIRCVSADGSLTTKTPPTPTELSVAPSSHETFPAERPDWVDAAPDLDGEIHRLPVTSMPCSSEQLCEAALQANLRGAVENYIETLTGDEASSSVVVMDDQWIADHRDGNKYYMGSVIKGDEVLYESATELVFDKQAQETIHRLWKRRQVGQRMAIVGFLTGTATIGLVGIAAVLSIVTRRAEQRVAR